MFSKVRTNVCVFGTKNTQLPFAIGSVHKARGYKGEGYRTAGQPAGSLQEINPVGSCTEATHAYTQPVAL